MRTDELIALRCQPPRVEQREAQSVALALYGIDARATDLGGERDRNFLLQCADRRLVLKFIDPGIDPVIVDGQTAVLAHLAEQGASLPVPRVIQTIDGKDLGTATIEGGTCPVRLVTYVPGFPLLAASAAHGTHTAPAGATSLPLLRSTGSLIGRLDRALRGFQHPSLAQPIAWDIRHAQQLVPVLEQVQSPAAHRLIAAALAPLPQLLPRLRGLRAQAVHGDCHPGNLLTDESGQSCSGVIDFGDMIHAPLALEVAVAMAEFLTCGIGSIDSVGEIICGYTETQPLERADVDVLFESVAARIAVGALIQGWRSTRGPASGSSHFCPSDAEMSALEQLLTMGRERITGKWQEAAGGIALRRPVLSDLLARRRRALGANAELSYENPLHPVRAEGVWMYNAECERFLDVYNNVPHVGHAHPAVIDAVTRQSKLIASNTRYLDERIIEYAERLTATLPAGLDTCLFVNSGSEANDIAWRIATAHTGNRGALVLSHAYHGITEAVTDLSPSISPRPAAHVEQLAAPLYSDRSRTDTAALEALSSAAASDAEQAIARLRQRGFAPATFMIDSALTSTGIHDPAPEWIDPIVRQVRQCGALVIGDEVQFGLGRSGSAFWGFERRGYVPDLVTLGKPVGNGFPLGVVITRRELLERFQKATGFFSTFGGNPVAAAAGLAVLQVLERERLQDNAHRTGEYFIGRLRAISHPSIAAVRGHGLMIGVEIAAGDGTARARTGRIVNAMRARGVLIGSEGPHANVLKLRPPLPFRPEHADIAVAALEGALRDADRG